MPQFTKTENLALINHVKEHPLLYDPEDPKYMDLNSREVIWQMIGDQMKRPATECKMRWGNIREVYRRLYKTNLESSGKTKLYIYHNELSFMEGIVLRKSKLIIKTETDPGEEQKDADDSINDDSINSKKADEDSHQHGEREIFAYYEPTEDSESELSTRLDKKRKLSKCVKNEIIKKQPEVADHISRSATVAPVQLDPSDPVDSFLLSIGTVLKNLPQRELNFVKTKIFAIVQEHDLLNVLATQNT